MKVYCYWIANNLVFFFNWLEINKKNFKYISHLLDYFHHWIDWVLRTLTITTRTSLFSLSIGWKVFIFVQDMSKSSNTNLRQMTLKTVSWSDKWKFFSLKLVPINFKLNFCLICINLKLKYTFCFSLQKKNNGVSKFSIQCVTKRFRKKNTSVGVYIWNNAEALRRLKRNWQFWPFVKFTLVHCTNSINQLNRVDRSNSGCVL